LYSGYIVTQPTNRNFKRKEYICLIGDGDNKPVHGSRRIKTGRLDPVYAKCDILDCTANKYREDAELPCVVCARWWMESAMLLALGRTYTSKSGIESVEFDLQRYTFLFIWIFEYWKIICIISRNCLWRIESVIMGFVACTYDTMCTYSNTTTIRDARFQ